MKRITCMLFAAGLILVPLCLRASPAAYHIADVGSFGYAIVFGMNNAGTVVGATSSTPSTYSAFTWNQVGGLHYLSPLPGYEMSYARGVNDQGQVVGYSSSSGVDRACLWNSGQQAVDIGVLPSGETAPSSRAEAINSGGQVVGWCSVGGGSNHAFLWREVSGMDDITPTSTAPHLYAYGINDGGAVVGTSEGDAFIWDRAAGMSSVGSTAIGIDINNSGHVLCVYPKGAGGTGAYVWQDGHEIVLGELPGGVYNDSTEALDINNIGVVVGQSNGQPFIWNARYRIMALPMFPDLTDGVASAINDNGVIAGTALDAQGNTHILLWTPVPEPSSLAALLAGLAGLGAVIRRRRRA